MRLVELTLRTTRVFILRHTLSGEDLVVRRPSTLRIANMTQLITAKLPNLVLYTAAQFLSKSGWPEEL